VKEDLEIVKGSIWTLKRSVKAIYQSRLQGTTVRVKGSGEGNGEQGEDGTHVVGTSREVFEDEASTLQPASSTIANGSLLDQPTATPPTALSSLSNGTSLDQLAATAASALDRLQKEESIEIADPNNAAADQPAIPSAPKRRGRKPKNSLPQQAVLDESSVPTPLERGSIEVAGQVTATSTETSLAKFTNTPSSAPRRTGRIPKTSLRKQEALDQNAVPSRNPVEVAAAAQNLSDQATVTAHSVPSTLRKGSSDQQSVTPKSAPSLFEVTSHNIASLDQSTTPLPVPKRRGRPPEASQPQEDVFDQTPVPIQSRSTQDPIETAALNEPFLDQQIIAPQSTPSALLKVRPLDQPTVTPQSAPKRRGRPPKKSLPEQVASDQTPVPAQSSSKEDVAEAAAAPNQALFDQPTVASQAASSTFNIATTFDQPTNMIQPAAGQDLIEVSTRDENALCQPTPTPQSAPKRRGRPPKNSLSKNDTPKQNESKQDQELLGPQYHPTTVIIDTNPAPSSPTRKRMVAVFKLTALKVPQWLGSKSKQWKTRFRQKTGQSATEFMEDVSLVSEDEPGDGLVDDSNSTPTPFSARPTRQKRKRTTDEGVDNALEAKKVAGLRASQPTTSSAPYDESHQQHSPTEPSPQNSVIGNGNSRDKNSQPVISSQYPSAINGQILHQQQQQAYVSPYSRAPPAPGGPALFPVHPFGMFSSASPLLPSPVRATSFKNNVSAQSFNDPGILWNLQAQNQASPGTMSSKSKTEQTLHNQPIGPPIGSFKSADLSSTEAQVQRQEFFTPTTLPTEHGKGRGRKRASTNSLNPPSKRKKVSDEPKDLVPGAMPAVTDAIQSSSAQQFTPHPLSVQPLSMQDSHIESTSSMLQQGEQLQDSPRVKEITARQKVEQEQKEFYRKLDLAEDVQYSDARVQLPCAFQGSVGNLILSKDRHYLYFKSLDQPPEADALLVIPVRTIPGDTIMSARGSRPVELRIKSKDDNDVIVTYAFDIGMKLTARTVANGMSSNIATARIIVRRSMDGDGESERPQEIPAIEEQKPFVCEICGGRWKNEGGLKYHVSKSNTTCNPNFDPKVPIPSPGRPKKAESTSKSTRKRRMDSANGKPANDTTEIVQEAEEQPEEEESESETGSVDSIIEWAQRVNNIKTNWVFSRRRGERRNVASLANRVSSIDKTVLKEIMEDLALENDAAGPAAAVESAPNMTTDDSKTDKQCKDVLMSLVEGNRGLFPGDKSLWYCFVTAWGKKHVRSNVLPDWKVYRKTLDSLIAECKLLIDTSTFAAKDSTTATCTIVTTPGFDTSSPAIEMLKDFIQEMHPRVFVPSKFAPSSQILQKLQSIPEPSDEQQPPEQSDIADAVIRGNRRASVVSDQSSVSAFEDNEEDEDPLEHDLELTIEDEDLADEYEEPKKSGNRNRKRKPTIVIPGETQEQKKLRISQQASERMKAKWAPIKARGANTLSFPDRYVAKGTNIFRKVPFPEKPEKRVRVRTMVEQNARRSEMAAMRIQCWDMAKTSLPDPETGAWNQSPERPARKIYTKSRVRLPEPITFMQSENGAWDVRPFGHGVNPVYARPARRADGNPNFQRYLKNLQSGHRPVLMPTKRLFLPSRPTAKLLRDPLSYKAPRAKRNSVISDLSPKRSSTPATPTTPTAENLRISRRTGKSVRTYSRPSQGATKPRERIPQVKDATPETSSRSMRLDEIHMLNAMEPKKIVPGEAGSRNPGLESLPASFGLRFAHIDPQILKNDSTPSLSDEHMKHLMSSLASVETSSDVLFDIDEMAKWEQGAGSQVLCSGTIAPDYQFINHAVNELECVMDQKHIRVDWNDEREFDMETLPYETLGETEDLAFLEVLASPVPVKPAAKKFRNSRPRLYQHKSRPLTSLATDLELLGDDVERVAEELGAQFVPRSKVARTKHGARYINEDVEARLIVAVCVMRTLTGGLEQSLDWVLISTLFETFTTNFLMKSWPFIAERRSDVIEKLGREFPGAFLEAYEKGEIPQINFDDLVSYNWAWLVGWTMKRLDFKLNVTPKVIDLPGSREALEQLYDIHVPEQETANPADTFYPLKAPVYERMEDAYATQDTIPVFFERQITCADEIKIDDSALVKSFVISSALSPDDNFSQAAAEAKFRSLGDPLKGDRNGIDPYVEKLANDVLAALTKEKVFVRKNNYKAKPGRAYQATNAFFTPLRKTGKESQFLEAMQFKRSLDSEFKSGKKCIRHDHKANEGTVMCVMQLQAHGRIRLEPAGLPTGLFEMTDDEDEIPDEKLLFEMDIYPTEHYIYDSDNAVLELHSFIEAPRGGKRGEIPCWYGICDRVIPDIWKKVLVAVAGTVASSAGTSVKALKQHFKPTLEEWELWRILEWGVEVGIFVKLPGPTDAWTVGEWWWVVVGQVVEGMAE
jgi:hypothetical protein